MVLGPGTSIFRIHDFHGLTKPLIICLYWQQLMCKVSANLEPVFKSQVHLTSGQLMRRWLDVPSGTVDTVVVLQGKPRLNQITVHSWLMHWSITRQNKNELTRSTKGRFEPERSVCARSSLTGSHREYVYIFLTPAFARASVGSIVVR